MSKAVGLFGQATQALDESAGVAGNVFWLQLPKGAEDGTTEEEEGVLDPWEELPADKQLQDVLQYLRNTYCYCTFCGCRVCIRPISNYIPLSACVITGESL